MTAFARARDAAAAGVLAHRRSKPGDDRGPVTRCTQCKEYVQTLTSGGLRALGHLKLVHKASRLARTGRRRARERGADHLLMWAQRRVAVIVENKQGYTPLHLAVLRQHGRPADCSTGAGASAVAMTRDSAPVAFMQ